LKSLVEKQLPTTSPLFEHGKNNAAKVSSNLWVLSRPSLPHLHPKGESFLTYPLNERPEILFLVCHCPTIWAKWALVCPFYECPTKLSPFVLFA
jgi:hypothetical protein